MNKLNLSPCLVFFFIIGCKSNNLETKIFQKNRDNIINVSDKIVDINPDLIFGNSTLHIIDNILIVNEVSPKGEKGIHLFDKNTFKYITSTGTIGRGPGEISVPGIIGIDKKNRIIWVPDNGNKVMWKIPLDSILHNTSYKHTLKFELNYESFRERVWF